MLEPIDLEVTFHRKDAETYGVELRLNSPDSETPVSPLGAQTVTVQFDAQILLEQRPDPVAYGHSLGAMLFADPALRSAWASCRAAAQSQGRSLRMRLNIAADAPELHAICWETLPDPQTNQPVALSEQIILSRTLGSADWQPVKLRAKAALRALVLIAAPADQANYGLHPLDVAAEQQRAVQSLGAMRTTVLAAPGEASLPTLLAHLRDGYDLLYVIAHGAMVRGEPWVFLDDGLGRTARVAGSELAARLADLPTRPRLVLLASCEGAGDGTTDALAALGPRLATAGLAAVIAMHGRFSIASHARFAPVLLHELQRDGQIDRALAVARQALADQPDWWMPVLFTRLRSGRIWYEPGFDSQDFAKWPTVVRSIERGTCTPILGPGLLDGLAGSTRDLARRLAERHNFPLAPDARDDLPQVAQYLAVHQDLDFLRDELEQVLREQIGPVPDLPAHASLDQVFAAAAAQQWAQHSDEPHAILARLPLPIYLSANPDRVLADALNAAAKAPQVRSCPWNRHGEIHLLDQAPLTPPSVATPLVYHLFGRFDDPETMVLTEDDYFRYLIGVTRNEDLFPKAVGSALVNSALLFLGFRLDDWNFRVLFQSVMNLAGAELRRRHTHVAVQLDPQEDRVLDPRAAREYLKGYFGSTSALQYQTNISIYWGSAEDFLRELALRVSHD